MKKEDNNRNIATVYDVAFCKQFCNQFENCQNLMNEKKELVAPCNWTEIEPDIKKPDGCQTI